MGAHQLLGEQHHLLVATSKGHGVAQSLGGKHPISPQHRNLTGRKSRAKNMIIALKPSSTVGSSMEQGEQLHPTTALALLFTKYSFLFNKYIVGKIRKQNPGDIYF